jgi:hypothetical protein
MANEWWHTVTKPGGPAGAVAPQARQIHIYIFEFIAQKYQFSLIFTKKIMILVINSVKFFKKLLIYITMYILSH